MTKIEHLQFLVLLLPTFLILVAAAVSMAELALPAQNTYTVASAAPVLPYDAVWDDRPAE